MTRAAADLSPDLVPTWVGAIATSAGVLVAIIAIALAYVQLRQTAVQMRRTSAQEAQDSEDRTRPYIGVDLVTGLAGHASFDIVIENYGHAVARDVRLRLVDEEFKAQSSADGIGPALGRLFSAGFDLAPGARRRVFWRLPDSTDATPRGDFGAPEAGEVVTSYGWQPGDSREVRLYEERLRYDLSEYPKLAPLPSAGPSTSGAGANVDLKNVLHALHSIAGHVAELRR